MNVTEHLKRELWRRFGDPNFPAEWDGHVYGGGKLSQRYWEYFKAVELLDLDSSSVVVEIGGGSPATGVGFFANLLASRIRRVIVVDPNLIPAVPLPANVETIPSNATPDVLRRLFAAQPDITHVACVSVLEHVPDADREAMMAAIEAHFRGHRIVVTLEYHARRSYFDFQLTARSVSALLSPLVSFFPDRIEASPVWAENAFDTQKLVKFSRHNPIAVADIPRWYPLAVRLVRPSD